MNKSTKILIGTLVTLTVLALAIIGWLLYGKKTDSPNLTSWALPKISELGTSNTPGQLFGPEVSTKARNLSPDKIIEITNKYRIEEKLAPLTKNEILFKAANAKINDMFAKQYFEHVSPSGVTPAQLVLKSGYNYKVTGENLALGDFKNEQELVDAWMASPGHRANILNPDYKEIGVATGINDYQGRNTWLAVQEFGVQAPNCANPDKYVSDSIDSKKAEYLDLSNQMSNLAKEAQSLLDQSNQQIAQGNTIYSQTHNKTKAQPYWDEGQKLRNQSQSKLTEAQKIDAQLKDLYNQIDTLVIEYNTEVNSYNKCVKS